MPPEDAVGAAGVGGDGAAGDGDLGPVLSEDRRVEAVEVAAVAAVGVAGLVNGGVGDSDRLVRGDEQGALVSGSALIGLVAPAVRGGDLHRAGIGHVSGGTPGAAAGHTAGGRFAHAAGGRGTVGHVAVKVAIEALGGRAAVEIAVEAVGGRAVGHIAAVKVPGKALRGRAAGKALRGRKGAVVRRGLLHGLLRSLLRLARAGRSLGGLAGRLFRRGAAAPQGQPQQQAEGRGQAERSRICHLHDRIPPVFHWLYLIPRILKQSKKANIFYRSAVAFRPRPE